MDQKKYTLTCHTYPDHLRRMMREMMTSKDFADVTLVCDDKKVLKAHRNILTAFSPVFKDILQIHAQSNDPVIYLMGIQYSEIESILQFMYLGEAKLYKDRRNEFLCAVKDLEIKELSKRVESSDQRSEIKEETEKHFNKSTENHAIDDDNITGEEGEIVGSKNGMQQNEAGKQKFQCTHCDKSFSSAPGLTKHNKSKHEGVNHDCNQCDYKATTQSHLKRHIQSKHERIKYPAKTL